MPGPAKGIAKHAPEAFQNPAQHVPKPDKIEGRRGSESQNAPKRHPRPAKRRPRTPKKCPRATQEAPKRAQEPPKSAQKPAKWRPRAAQEGPRPFQNRAQRLPRWVFSTIFVGSCVCGGPGLILYRCWCILNVSRKNLKLALLGGSTGKTVAFAHPTMLQLAHAFARNNYEKSTFWASKILLGASLTPSKSSPEHPKTHKNRPRATTNAARYAKCGQESPKSEK